MIEARKIGTGLLILWVLLISRVSFAADEVLTFQRTLSGEYTAVITGTTDGCEQEAEKVQIYPPSSVTVSGNTISILSPFDGRGCGVRPLPYAYRVEANLGRLPQATFSVSWYVFSIDDPVKVLTGELSALAPEPFGAPALSTMASVLLAMLTALLGVASARVGSLSRHRR